MADDNEKIKFVLDNYTSRLGKIHKKAPEEFIKWLKEYCDYENDTFDVEMVIEDVNETQEDSSFIAEIDELNLFTSSELKQIWKCVRFLTGVDEESFVMLHQLNQKTDDKDIKKTKEYITKYFPKTLLDCTQEDDSFLVPMAIGLNNNIQLQTLLLSVYNYWKSEFYTNPSFRAKLKNHKIDQADRHSWYKSSKYLTKNFKNDKETVLISWIQSLTNRAMPEYQKGSGGFDDSPTQFIKTVQLTSQMISNLLKTNNKCLPLQIDLWVIPKGKSDAQNIVEISDDDEDDDDDDDDDGDDGGDEKEQGDDSYAWGNIVDLLKKHNIKPEIVNDFDCDKEALSVRGMKAAFDKVLAGDRSKRICIVVDRRELNDKNKPKLYIYKPVNDDIPNGFSELQLMFKTKEYMIPSSKSIKTTDKNKAVTDAIGGGNALESDGFMCTFSFQLHSEDEMKLYCFMGGWAVRFWPQYFHSMFPSYFAENDLKKNGLDENSIKKGFKLELNDDLFNAWNKQINNSLF